MKAAATAGAEVHQTALPARLLTADRRATVIQTDTATATQTAEVHRIPADQVTVILTPTAEPTEHPTVFRKETATVIPKARLYPIPVALPQAAVRRLRHPPRCHRAFLPALHTEQQPRRAKEPHTAHQVPLAMELITAPRKVFPRAYPTVRAAGHPFRTAMEHPVPAAILTVLPIPMA